MAAISNKALVKKQHGEAIKSFLPRDSREHFYWPKYSKLILCFSSRWRQVEHHFFSSSTTATNILKHTGNLQPITQLTRKGHTLSQAKLILPRDDAVPVCPNPTCSLPSPLLPAQMYLKLCRELSKSYFFVFFFLNSLCFYYYLKVKKKPETTQRLQAYQKAETAWLDLHKQPWVTYDWNSGCKELLGILISPFNSIISANYKYFPLIFLKFCNAVELSNQIRCSLLNNIFTL